MATDTARADTAEAIEDLQRRLEAAADPKVQSWWESYLKGEASFRGVRMPVIRELVGEWHREPGLEEWAPAERKRLALDLLAQHESEDKIAGILLLREHLLGEVGVEDLPAFERLFAEGHIADWSICDWFSVKLLSALVARDGRPMAEALAVWRHAEPLWQRRAAAVALAPLAPRGEASFPGFVELALEVCEANLRDPARFAQTGVGWLLRELSKAEPEQVGDFVAAHEETMSREARRMALAKIEGRGRR